MKKNSNCITVVFSLLLSACTSTSIVSPTPTETYTPVATITPTHTKQPTKKPVATHTITPANTPHPRSIDYGQIIVENNLPLDTAPQYGFNLLLFDLIKKIFSGLSKETPFSLNGLEQYPGANNRVVTVWTGSQDIDLGINELTLSRETLKALNGQVAIFIYYDNAPSQPYMEAWENGEIEVTVKGSTTVYHPKAIMLCGPRAKHEYNSYVGLRKSNKITIHLRKIFRMDIIRLNPDETLDDLIDLLRVYEEIPDTELPIFFNDSQLPLYNHIILCR